MLSKLRFLSLLCISLLIVSCAGSSNYMKPSESLLAPTNEKALVRFMRPSGFGYAINFNIWDGEKVIGNSVAKSQFDYLTDPGKHLFVAIAENKAFLEADLEAGKIYYILTQVKMGAWKARVGLVSVTRGSEFWDKVKEYENELSKLQPETAALKLWEDKNKPKIQAILGEYETTLKTSESWPKLNPADGR
jgi:hypothetical protein